MAQILIKVCPTCHKSSKGDHDIDKKHGFRMIRGKKFPQSLCRLCRNTHKRQVREFKTKNNLDESLDLRFLKHSKVFKSVLSTKNFEKEIIPKIQGMAKKLNITNQDVSVKGTIKNVKWLSLSKQNKLDWIKARKDNRSVWNKLSKEQKERYNLAHKNYLNNADKIKKGKIVITKKKFLKKKKALSNFKKDLNTFQKATMTKAKNRRDIN